MKKKRLQLCKEGPGLRTGAHALPLKFEFYPNTS